MSSILAGLVIQLASSPLMAAQRVVFRIGEPERSVPVADLASFQGTGTIGENIPLIINTLSQQDRHALPFSLGHPFSVNSLEVSDFLQRAMGEVVLRQFA